jgi:hypothetical protein
MNTTPEFNYKLVLLIAIGFLLVGACINPILDNLANHWSAHLTIKPPVVRHGLKIPGMAYSMAEVQCRTWHRNRANRPFNFALIP